FSSRRRHTRFSRDWSSDVCSSDLSIRVAYYNEGQVYGRAGMGYNYYNQEFSQILRQNNIDYYIQFIPNRLIDEILNNDPQSPPRSEERRVGQEHRCLGRLDN